MRTLSPTLLLLSLSLSGCFDGQLVRVYEHSFDIDDIESIEIENGRGNLEIVGDQAPGEIEVRAELRSFHLGSYADEEAEDAVIIDGDSEDNVFELLVTLDDPPAGFHLDVEVTIPDSIPLYVRDSSGNVSIDGVDAVDAETGSGNVYVSDVSGDVDIVDESGDLEVVDVGGSVHLEDGSGDIAVYDVDEDVTIRDGSGDIIVRSVAGTVTLWDGSGDIDVRDAGEVLIKEDGSGNIDID